MFCGRVSAGVEVRLTGPVDRRGQRGGWGKVVRFILPSLISSGNEQGRRAGCDHRAIDLDIMIMAHQRMSAPVSVRTRGVRWRDCKQSPLASPIERLDGERFDAQLAQKLTFGDGGAAWVHGPSALDLTDSFNAGDWSVRTLHAEILSGVVCEMRGGRDWRALQPQLGGSLDEKTPIRPTWRRRRTCSRLTRYNSPRSSEKLRTSSSQSV